jgi:hypothetical protein
VLIKDLHQFASHQQQLLKQSSSKQDEKYFAEETPAIQVYDTATKQTASTVNVHI